MSRWSSIRPRSRRALAPVALAVGALTLGACGGSAAHVIGPGIAPTTTVSTVPGGAQTTTTTTTTVPSGGSHPATTVAPTTAPAPSINQQTVSQIDSELNALDQSLNNAQSAVSSNDPGDQ
jgi:hypothetical protein